MIQTGNRADTAHTPIQWDEARLTQAVAQLQGQIQPDAPQHAVVRQIVQLGMQPDILAALCRRSDPAQAVRDLATRYAFARLYAHEPLDRMSQTLVDHMLGLIHSRAEQIACRTGDNPLDEVPDLLNTLCKSLARYVPRKPMSAHIQWKLRRYEGPVSRAMRQIEHLTRHPAITEAFVGYVLEAEAPATLKAYLLQMARGGGRRGLDPEQVIRFFAQPATVAFVKRFARTVHTARTLYAEVEYAGVPWQGRRRLAAARRQGYLNLALARIERRHDRSLDAGEDDQTLGGYYEALAGPGIDPDMVSLHNTCFEAWVTEQTLGHQPENPHWQICHHLYIKALSPETIIARGLATAEMVVAARQQMEKLRATPAVWEAWMEKTLAT